MIAFSSLNFLEACIHTKTLAIFGAIKTLKRVPKLSCQPMNERLVSLSSLQAINPFVNWGLTMF